MGITTPSSPPAPPPGLNLRNFRVRQGEPKQTSLLLVVHQLPLWQGKSSVGQVARYRIKYMEVCSHGTNPSVQVGCSGSLITLNHAMIINPSYRALFCWGWFNSVRFCKAPGDFSGAGSGSREVSARPACPGVGQWVRRSGHTKKSTSPAF